MVRDFMHSFRKPVMVWFGMSAMICGALLSCSSGGSGSSGGGNGNAPPPVNQGPTATISSPSGTFFKEGENIVFSGIATDAEDGQLNDTALVWTSNIDGPVGNGATLITSVLSPGDHAITLSATDSKGAVTTTEPVAIRVASTRFLKMGGQTTGSADAFHAFDGDHDTAATISTSEAEFIHFKAYIGGADTFIFQIKLGASLHGSVLAIEGLIAEDTWQPVSDIYLDADRTVTVTVTEAQVYRDADGYVNLRAILVNDHNPDTVSIYELWRIDPVYAGARTEGVDNFELAFDGDLSKPATITGPSTSGANFLHFEAYVGLGQLNTFSFNILLNRIGSGHYLVVEVENIISGGWEFVEDLSLDMTDARTVSVQNAQRYLDADGYINLRAYWFTFVPSYPSGTNVKIFEIWSIDPFVVGHKTSFVWVANPESAVDGDLDSYATIYYFWGEYDHRDFLHLKTYVGDTSPITFSIAAALSAPPGAEVIVDGEVEPDSWSVIQRITLDALSATTVELPNARAYVNADGYLSLRLRFESDSISHDAFIYEIWREVD
jgi:hypothetical protein